MHVGRERSLVHTVLEFLELGKVSFVTLLSNLILQRYVHVPVIYNQVMQGGLTSHTSSIAYKIIWHCITKDNFIVR